MDRDQIRQAAAASGMFLSDADLDKIMGQISELQQQQQEEENQDADVNQQHQDGSELKYNADDDDQQDGDDSNHSSSNDDDHRKNNINKDEDHDDDDDAEQHLTDADKKDKEYKKQLSSLDTVFGDVDKHFDDAAAQNKQQQQQRQRQDCEPPTLTTGALSYSIVRAGVAEQLRLNAHSFAATRAVPHLWRWGAFCKLRAEVNAEAQAQLLQQQVPPNSAAAKKSNSGKGKKKAKAAATAVMIPDQEIVDRLPLPALLGPKPAADVTVLRIASCIPCASFTTHCVAVADTQVKYFVSQKIPSAAAVLDPSLLRSSASGKKKNNRGTDEENQQEEEEQQKHRRDFAVEATIVWRTMHFVRHDCKSIEEQGNFEIQSTNLRHFACYPVGSDLPLAWAGFTFDDQLYSSCSSLPAPPLPSSAPHHHQRADPIFFTPPRAPLYLRRSCLECYTRPTIHFVFAWMLWQNNKDLRAVIQKKMKSATARKRAKTAVAAGASVVTGAAGAAAVSPFNNNSCSSSTTSRRRDRGGKEQQNEHEDNVDDEEEEEEVTIVDFLTDIKNKIWLNLFDHAPVFGVLGMGGNVIGNYLAALFPWCDVHVAELDSSVIASNKLNGDFPTRLKPSYGEEGAGSDGGEDGRYANAADVTICGRQFSYHRDVFELLGVPLNGASTVSSPTKKDGNPAATGENGQEVIVVDDDDDNNDSKQQQQQSVTSSPNDHHEESTVFDRDDFFSLLFLDCFDPVSVNMDHSRRVLRACHSRLRVNGILAVNTHLALTYRGEELRPFCEVFPGSESVQVVSIAGFQQALIVCQKRSPASIKRGPAQIFGSVREYRAVARVGSTCPVHVKLAGGLLRNVETPQFFAPNMIDDSAQETTTRAGKKQQQQDEKKDAAAAAAASSSSSASSSDDDDDDDNDDVPLWKRMSKGAQKKHQQQQQQLEDSSSWDFEVDDDVPFSARLNGGGGGGGKKNKKNIGNDDDDDFFMTTDPMSLKSQLTNNTDIGEHNNSSAAEKRVLAAGPRARHYSRSSQCKARWRISDPCACLMCTTQFLDASIFEESVSLDIKLQKKKNEQDDDDDDDDAGPGAVVEEEHVSVRRWLTL